MMGPRSDDRSLFEWLGIDEQQLLDAMAPATAAIAASLRASGLNQRQAAFMVVMVMGAVLAAQPHATDRDRLMVEALLALDRVRDEWTKAHARRLPRPAVH